MSLGVERQLLTHGQPGTWLFDHGASRHQTADETVFGVVGACMDLERQPGARPQFRVDLGNYHLLHANYQDALSEFRVALQIDPAQVYAWYFMGQAYGRTGDFENALEAWKKVREIKPDFPKIDDLIRAAERQIKPPQRP